MAVKLYKLTIYGSPHIGIFAYVNNKFAIVPVGTSKTAQKTIEEILEVEVIETTIGGSRLLGVFLSGNDRVLLVSPIIYPQEFDELKSTLEGKVSLRVFETRNTAIGNLIVTNNKGALVSSDFSENEVKILGELLDTRVYRTQLLNYKAIGSLIACNDRVALTHPLLEESELSLISEVLGVTASGATVNEGIGLVKSGVLMNNKGILVGSMTTGPELMNIQSIVS